VSVEGAVVVKVNLIVRLLDEHLWPNNFNSKIISRCKMLKKGNLFNVILVLQVIIFVRYEARSSCNDR
jgi:hypothetical protein